MPLRSVPWLSGFWSYSCIWPGFYYLEKSLFWAHTKAQKSVRNDTALRHTKQCFSWHSTISSNWNTPPQHLTSSCLCVAAFTRGTEPKEQCIRGQQCLEKQHLPMQWQSPCRHAFLRLPADLVCSQCPSLGSSPGSGCHLQVPRPHAASTGSVDALCSPSRKHPAELGCALQPLRTHVCACRHGLKTNQSIWTCIPLWFSK